MDLELSREMAEPEVHSVLLLNKFSDSRHISLGVSSLVSLLKSMISVGSPAIVYFSNTAACVRRCIQAVAASAR